MKMPRFGAMSCIVLIGMATVAIGAGFAEGTGGAVAVEWRAVVFGQSTNAKDNTIEVQPDGSVIVSSLNGKGKVTGAHDGIAYYYSVFDPSVYNFTLSADIEVITYANDNDPAKPKPNNQEAFGIMIRDAIGTDGDSTVFASNMVYAGGYRGQLQAVMRENVEESSGAGAKMTSASLNAQFPGKGSKFGLTVKKTNTGYHVLLNDNQAGEVIFYRPDIMQVQNKSKLYAGFFAARNASIKVSNIVIGFSDPRTDHPAVPEPPKPVVPDVSIASPLETSAQDYRLIVSANVNGTLGAAKAGTAIFPAEQIAAGEELIRSLSLASGENVFDFTFTPAEGQFVTSGTPIKKQVKIIAKAFGDPSTPINVSPDGKPDGDGSSAKPVDIFTAVKYVQPGQSIILAGGTYKLGAPLVLQRGNDGTQAEPKKIQAAENSTAVLSFENSAPGLQILGDWWIVSGVSVTKSTSTGIRISGHHNVVEKCGAFANANTGIQISGSSLDKKEKWPSFNLVSASVAHDNKDQAESDADGFAAKLTVGKGNVFLNCVAHNNCDDGWDLYTKLEMGPIEPVLVENCVAYGNGTLSDGTMTRGDGNGFKLGGEGIAVAHEVRNCVSFANKTAGFTSNSNPAVRIQKAFSADNGGANFSFSVYGQTKPEFVLSSLYSLRTAAGPADVFAPGLLSGSVYLFDGTISKNGKGETLNPDMFRVVQPPAEILPGPDGMPDLKGYIELKN